MVRKAQRPTAVAFTLSLMCVASTAAQAVGVYPSDGTVVFVKEFSLSPGTTITGFEFQNNDATTTFPTVLLKKAAAGETWSGETLASSNDVRETSAGLVHVLWNAPVSVGEEGGVFLLGVQIPAWGTRIEPGEGPGIDGSSTAAPAGSYLTSGDDGELTPIHVNLSMQLLVTSPGKATATPPRFETFLGEAFPNPFNPSTTIEFGVAQRATVSLAIYTVAGRLVARLERGILEPGRYHRTWTGKDEQGEGVAAGIYFLRLQIGQRHFERRLVMVK